MKYSKFMRAESLWDFLKVRTVRNECCEFMTNHTKKISIIEQVKFWMTLKTNKNIEVYYFEINSEMVGYGLIKREGGRAWITGGIRAPFRGTGLGRDLFQRLIYHALPDKVWLEVMDWNKPALNLYRSLGFRKKDIRDKHVLIMKRT